MPELDGPGLYRERERRHPEMIPRLIFLTGDTLSAEITGFLEAAGAPSVSKLFALEEARRAVQSALARTGTGPPADGGTDARPDGDRPSRSRP